jgi:hypothetical protein
MGNATFHVWKMDCFTRKFLQAGIIPCFSAVMARLWHAEEIDMDNAKFPIQVSTIFIATWQVICELATLLQFFNSNFSQAQMTVLC